MFNFKKTNKSELVEMGVLTGVVEGIYVTLVAWFMSSAESIFKGHTPDPIFGAMAILSLLVFSAAISGTLVFGYPAYFFLQKKYRESFTVFISTLITILIIFVLIFFGGIFIF